ncbi:MAG: PIG-L family deacetylase [bacterium]|nr:PIG-L family deacetylase [bacterium]
MWRTLFYKNVYRFYEYISPHLKYSTPVEYEINAKKMLVIAPHPDDESIGCGGSIAMAIKKGIYIRVLFVTMDEERKLEHKDAMRNLGVFDYTSINLDIKNINQKILEECLIYNIKDVKPDIIMSPNPIDTHLDHRIVAKVLKNALAKVDINLILYLYSIWLPSIPNVLLDISQFFELKKNAILCYKSQIKDRDYFVIAKCINVYWANIKNKGQYLEPFLRLTKQAYLSFLKNL